MKKGSYWFSLLSEKEQKEYKENAKSDWYFMIENESESFAWFIAGGFIWEYTPQGNEYWSRISQRNVK